jgi:hypothetical protein
VKLNREYDNEYDDLFNEYKDYQNEYDDLRQTNYNYAKEMRRWASSKKAVSASPYMYGARLANLAREEDAKRAATEEKARQVKELVENLRVTQEYEERVSAVVKSSVGYTSVLNAKAHRMLRAGKRPRRDAGRFLLIGGGSLGAGSAVANLETGHAVIAAAQLPIALGIVAIASPLILKTGKDLWNWDTHSKAKVAAREAFVLAERESLRAWLSERYGVSVSDDVLAQLVAVVHEDAQQADFEDPTGRAFKFMKVSDAQGWFVFQTGVPVAQRKALDLSPSKAIDAPQVFTGEVALIHARVEEMLALLAKQPLSAEQSHVLNRIKQDVGATASTLASLAALGDLEAGQKRAAAVMGQLVEELNDLVAGKKAALLDELQVQGNYVKERRRVIGSGGLELVKPAAALEAAQEQQEAEA